MDKRRRASQRKPSRSGAAPRRRARREGGKGFLRTAGVMALLVCVNVYVFFFRAGLSIGDVQKKAELLIQGAAEAARKQSDGARGADPAPAREGRGVTVRLAPGDTLLGALSKAELPAGRARPLVDALAAVWDPRSAQVGDTAVVELDAEGEVAAMEYHGHGGAVRRVQRDRDGRLYARVLGTPPPAKHPKR